jgi:hypothetical protein
MFALGLTVQHLSVMLTVFQAEVMVESAGANRAAWLNNLPDKAVQPLPAHVRRRGESNPANPLSIGLRSIQRNSKGNRIMPNLAGGAPFHPR